MSHGLSSSRSPVAPNTISSHLVVKRGHHGRYRFVMIGDGEKIGGEVWLDTADSSRDGARALVLAKIAQLAESLLAGVATRLEADEGAKPKDVANLTDIGAPDPRFHAILGEGDHRGQV